MGEGIIIESVALGLDSGLEMLEITPSTTTIAQETEQDGSFPSDDFDIIISNVDAIGLVHEGDDQAFDRIYQWKPSFKTKVKKLNLILAAGLNVSAHTMGNYSLDSVQVIVTRNLPDGTQVGQPILDVTKQSGLSTFAAIGTQMFLFKVRTYQDFIINPAHVMQIRIIINITTGTGTEQIGLVPFFCFNTTATNKFFTNSQVKLHLKEVGKDGN